MSVSDEISSRPLIELAEGRDQDQRSALIAAYRRVRNSHRRREVTDLHVRELLTYILRFDRDGRGVQLSYDDVANVIDCERSTARAVVRRAETVYGLLAVTEDRYVRGGQAPNRYSIDWQAVASVNSGQLPAADPNPPPEPAPAATYAASGCVSSADAIPEPIGPGAVPDSILAKAVGHGPLPNTEAYVSLAVATTLNSQLPQVAAPAFSPIPSDSYRPGDTRRHPGDTRRQGAVTTQHPPDTTRHPYKENTLPVSLSLNTSAAASLAAAAEVKKFSQEEWTDVKRSANLLLRRWGRVLDRDLVWDVCVTAEVLERGFSAELVTRVSSGDVRKPRCYLLSVLRNECAKRGLDLAALRTHIPRPGPVTQESSP